MSFSIIPERPLGTMRIDLDKATLCVSLLTEGSSIRSTERVTGVHRDTICRLLRVVGGKCSDLLGRLSKKRENLKAAVALFAASYNLCWSHRTLKGCTPAMAAGLVRKPWTVGELLAA